MEAGPCLLTRLRAHRPMTEVAGEVHPGAPTVVVVKTEAAVPIVVRGAVAIVVRGAGRNEAAVAIVVRGAVRNARVSAAARCSHPRSRGCLSRPSPMT